MRRVVIVMAAVSAWLALMVAGCQGGGLGTGDRAPESGDRGPGSVVTDEFLDAIALVESGWNHLALGARGEVGAYQFSRAAWADASRLRIRDGHRPVRFEVGSRDPQSSRAHAGVYLRHLEERLAQRLRCQPNPRELYAVWNMGWTAFERRGFQLKKAPPTTQSAAQRVLNLVTFTRNKMAQVTGK